MKPTTGLALWLLIGAVVVASAATVISYPTASYACKGGKNCEGTVDTN